jgi:hypothetical protein
MDTILHVVTDGAPTHNSVRSPKIDGAAMLLPFHEVWFTGSSTPEAELSRLA